jgi:hypothetical protein
MKNLFLLTLLFFAFKANAQNKDLQIIEVQNDSVFFLIYDTAGRSGCYCNDSTYRVVDPCKKCFAFVLHDDTEVICNRTAIAYISSCDKEVLVCRDRKKLEAYLKYHTIIVRP